MTRVRAAAVWAALNLTILAGCDNVEWGGARVAVVPPPPQATTPEEVETGPTEERLPTGPILYYVRQVGTGATLLPLAEIAGDSLRPIEATADWERYGQRFISEHLRQGAEFALFHRGTRVGTFVAQSAGVPAADVCPRVPRATGILELMPGASQVREFLALSKPQAPPEPERRNVPVYAPDRRAQVMAPILAERLLRARGAQLPGNWTQAMAQLQPFPVAGVADLAFASTFLVSDTLGTGLDDEGYALFFIAQPVPQVGFDTAYVDFAEYARVGKQAPRVVDFLDWTRDGQPELVLEVYGTGDTWFEALGRIGRRWRPLLSTRCEPTAPAAPARTAPGPASR